MPRVHCDAAPTSFEISFAPFAPMTTATEDTIANAQTKTNENCNTIIYMIPESITGLFISFSWKHNVIVAETVLDNCWWPMQF